MSITTPLVLKATFTDGLGTDVSTRLPQQDGADNYIGNVIKAVVIVIIFVVSSMGNSAVVYMIGKNYQMRTVTNALLVSLSVSDLIATWCCMPFTVVSLIMNSWPFSDAFCVIDGFLASVSGIGSILMITLIAMDRLIAMMNCPGRTLTSKRAYVAICVVWFVSTVFSMPWYLVNSEEGSVYKPGFHHCMYIFHVKSSKFGLAYSSTVLSMCYGVPYILIAYCFGAMIRTIRTNDKQVRPAYSQAQNLIFQSEMRTATTVLIMIVMATLCWFPYLIMALLELLNIPITPASDFVSLVLTWIIRAMNPILYAIRNPNVPEMLNIKRTGHRSKSFTNIEATTPRVEQPEQNGHVISEENVRPRFDWAIVKQSPLSPRALFCGTRKGSDQDALQLQRAAESIRQSTSL